MVGAVEDKKGAIIALCCKYSVQRLLVVGSAVRDDFRPGESDVDYLVEFAPIGGHGKAHARIDMLDELHGAEGS